MSAVKSHPHWNNGKGIRFLRAHLDYQGDDCVLWPFHKNIVNGYGSLGFNGEQRGAHNLMCELVHGPRPSKAHAAAHSCHVRACVNPRHLSWKTHSENMLDKRENGTVNHAWWGCRGKLTVEQAAAIFDLKGQHTQAKLAEMFGVTESTVRSIQNGETWSKRIAAMRAA